MRYTAAHWGAYAFDENTGLLPLADDPAPSRIGRGWLSAATNNLGRVLSPVIRKGWLEGDRGAARSSDDFVRVTWNEAVRRVAEELTQVRTAHGNGAIFAGSYGWSSAGRFHHAQSQLRRFLNCFGGYVGSRETYSHAAAEVLFPYVLGMSQRQLQDNVTSIEEVAEHCELLLAFGGISSRTAQITASGSSYHEIPDWLERLSARGTRLVSVSPQRSDLASAEWVSIRPGTDTALMLALTYEIVASGRENRAFLERCASGWPQFRAYLTGQTDAVAKSADWAAPTCDVSADKIRTLAHELAGKRSMITVAWGLQRADHGEQPIWAALALASVLGQIGQPGTGFSFGYGSTSPVGRPTRLIPWPSVPQGQNPVQDFIPVARFADMLMHAGGDYRYNGETRTYPDIRLVYWVGGNPFHHHQDLRGLEAAWARPDTIIVHEHTWTASARRADIVLPATTPLERTDIMMNRRDPRLIYMSQLLSPVGEAQHDYEIFRRIAQHLGLEDQFTEGRDADAWLRRLWECAAEVAAKHGFGLPDFDRFRDEGVFAVPDAEEHRRLMRDFVDDPERAPLATESGRITLYNETIAGFGLEDCPGHPTWLPPVESLLDSPDGALHLISGQPDTRLHAQNDLGSEALNDKIKGREPVLMHPATASARGLAESDVVRLSNARGACLAGLRLSEDIRPDCVALATGAWFDPQIVGDELLEVHGNPNVLTIDKGCSQLSQGNIAHTALVYVEAWNGPLPALSIDRPPRILEAPG